jgi:hypothetical protein
MQFMRSRSRRVAAFIAATGGAIALVGLAAGSTGAYFTDVHAGQVDGTFGKVAISVDGIAVPSGDSTGGANNLSINWNNMLPGQDKTVTWTVTNTGTANESIWLAFDNSNGGWFNADGNSGINNLGTYGDAQINSPLLNADYNNLNNGYPEGTGPAPAIAYLPAENHVADLAPGQQTSFTFSFEYTAKLHNNALQGGPAFLNPLLYDLIATQQGIAPSDPNNGSIYTLPTPPAGYPTAGHTWNT